MADNTTTRHVIVGHGRTDEEQAKVSADLKAADEGRAAVGTDQPKTFRVRARSGRPGGHYRAGQSLPGPIAGEEPKWAEFETTEAGIKMLDADPSVFLETKDGGAELRGKGGKWPPEGLTPLAQASLRQWSVSATPDDAIDSTGKSIKTGEPVQQSMQQQAADQKAREGDPRKPR